MIAYAEEIPTGARVFVFRVYEDDAATPTTPGYNYTFLAVGEGDEVTIKAMVAPAGGFGPALIEAVRRELRRCGRWRRVRWHRFDDGGRPCPDFVMTLNPVEETVYG